MALRKCFILILLLIMVYTGEGFAQNQPGAIGVQRNITGAVWEIPENDSTGIAVPNAHIRLLHAGDSSMVKSLLSDSNGKFLFSNIQQGNYILVVSFIGYVSSYIEVTSARFRGNGTIDMGKIILKEDEILLKEIIVEAQIPEVVIRGDTMEYNPAAFKVREGAVVEDLLKLLPGIEVDMDGKIITSTQKEVRRVFVNGKDFFENDPKIATKNLTVDIVDKVQVIERQTDQTRLTGVDDGERETIINLSIKKDRMKGWMGNTTAGAGMLLDSRMKDGSRYNLQGMLNNFNETRQISFIGSANNINNQAFTSFSSTSGGIIVGNAVMVSNAVVVGSGGGVYSIDMSEGGLSLIGGGGGSGVSHSSSFGLNFSSTVNEKFKASGNVNYNFSENFTERNSFRSNLLIDSVSYRKSSSNSQRASRNLGFNSRMEYKPDSLLTVSFSQQLSVSFSNSHNQSHEETLAGDIDSTLVNRSNSNSESKSTGIAISGNLVVTRLFARKGRRLGLTLNGSLNLNSNSGVNLSSNEFFLQPGRNMNLDQESGTSSNSNSFSLRASYVEPLRENMNVSVFYDVRRNGTLNLRETYDYNDVEDAYSLLNTDYSKSLKNQFVTQTLGLSLNATKTKYYYNIGLNIVPSSTQSTSFIKNGITEGRDSILNQVNAYKVVNYSPQINFTYRFNQQVNLNFSYRGNTRQPSVSQLDPTPDNTNPLYIRSGNPNLLPSFTNSMSLSFNQNQKEKQRMLIASVDYSFTRNEIINYTEYEQGTGIQNTTPINENGTWNAGGNVMYNMPVGKNKRLKLNVNTRINYTNRVGYTTLNQESYRNISGSLSVSESIGLSYNKDWFSGQLRASANYSNTSNSLKSGQEQRNANYRISYNTQLTLPKNFIFNSDINYGTQRGLTAGYNKEEILWNMGFSKQFLKGNAGTLRFTWTDILQKRLNISRTITANYIEDYASNSLTSYVLVSFSYRFNKMGGGTQK